MCLTLLLFFFFHDTATTEIYTYGHTLSLHDALPIYSRSDRLRLTSPPVSMLTVSPEASACLSSSPLNRKAAPPTSAIAPTHASKAFCRCASWGWRLRLP